MLERMIDDSAHDKLFSEATFRIGEIHGSILKSAHAMDDLRWVTTKEKFSAYKSTEFGKQVGQDEIHWWIFENEANVDELLGMSEEALRAAQVLRVDSAKLKDNAPESYTALLASLKEFAERHLPDIKALQKYISLLEKRSEER